MISGILQVKAKIKSGEDLSRIIQELENAIDANPDNGDRCEALYLLSWVYLQAKEPDKAAGLLTEAVKVNNSFALAHFLLAKVYRLTWNSSKARAALEECLRLDFRAHYCRKTLVNMAYVDKDFVAVINYLADFGSRLHPVAFWKAVRVEALFGLSLSGEADREYRRLLQDDRLSRPLQKRMKECLGNKGENPFEKSYRANQEFFALRGIQLPDYPEAPYKICRFLNNNFVYDCETRRFVVSLDPAEVRLSIAASDVLMIYNPEDPVIFEKMKQIYHNADPRLQSLVMDIPVLVVEEYLPNWQLMMQLFDFAGLEPWRNVRFFIGVAPGELDAVLLDEATPFPNRLFGTVGPEFASRLAQLKAFKEQEYQRRMDLLRQYYTAHDPNPIRRILIVAGRSHDALPVYGELLEKYLDDMGYTCRLYREASLSFQAAKYNEAKVLDEFRPDRVVHLGSFQEETEVFSQIGLPYTGWLIVDKDFPPGFTAQNLRQKLLLTAGSPHPEVLIAKGYIGEHIFLAPLPANWISIDETAADAEENDIGIIADYEELDGKLRSVIQTVYRQFATAAGISLKRLEAVCQGIYFEIYTELLNKTFGRSDLDAYLQVATMHFEKWNWRDPNLNTFTAQTFKSVMESPLLKEVQVNWVLKGMAGFGLELYGGDWDKAPHLAPFFEGTVDYLRDLRDYRRVVLRNKVNLYIGNRLPGRSLMQPDLINGLAAGGFFLVNDLTVKEAGNAVLTPFNGLLETYGSREELLAKLRYFLNHDRERRDKAAQLQAYIRKNFDIARVAKVVMAGEQQPKENFN